MKMNKITAFTRQYPLSAFFFLAFVLTTPMNLIANAIFDVTQSIPLALPFAILGAGPLLSALIVSVVIGGKAGLLALLRKLTIWRVGLGWYIVSLLLLPLLHLFAIYLNVLLGAPAPSAASFGTWSAMLGAFALRLVNPFDGPMLEELGWRGFAQPRLQTRYTPLTANLILGLLVTAWHLPLILTGSYEWIYIPGTMAATILFGWVYNASGGSVLLTLIMHAVEPLVAVSFSGADETRFMGLLVLVYVVTAAIVVLFTGKNLGRKEAFQTQAEREHAAAPA
jgi:membrane protease YdiL (CAAX protease family)